MIIREFRKSDTASFCDAIGEVAQERRYILTTEAPSLQKINEWVETYLNEPHAHFIAEDNGRVVGWADIIRLKRPSLAHIGNLGMGVLAAYRGRGVGNELIKHTLDKAWEIGLERIQLEVFSNNAAALNLYQKHGFEIEGHKRKACYMNDEYLDIICMAQFKKTDD